MPSRRRPRVCSIYEKDMAGGTGIAIEEPTGVAACFPQRQNFPENLPVVDTRHSR